MKIALYVIRALFFACAVGTGSYLAKLAHADRPLAYIEVAGGMALVLIVTEAFFSRSPIAIVSAITFGTISGFLMGYLFTGLIEVVAQPQPQDLQAIRLILTLIFAYLGITLLLQTKDDFKFVIPYVEFSRELRGQKPVVLDTSAIIDGRFADLCRAGLFESPIVVPRFVVDELQALADSGDKAKRAKGRRGLDAIKAMRDARVEVEIVDRETGADAGAAVDRKLVALAGRLGGAVVTTDSGLQKIAELERVKVLNVHEIARCLNIRVAAGDRLLLKLVKPGEGAEQGVGYLDDGSLVVVEKARSRVGEDVTVEVTGSLKTSGGQMFFAKIAG